MGYGFFVLLFLSFMYFIDVCFFFVVGKIGFELENNIDVKDLRSVIKKFQFVFGFYWQYVFILFIFYFQSNNFDCYFFLV